MTGFDKGTDQGRFGIGHHRHIIRAIDRDGDRLIDIGTEVIDDAGGVGLGDRFSFLQELGSGEGVIQRVGPLAGLGVDRDRAVGGGRCALEVPGAGGAGIHIGGAQLAADEAGAIYRGAVIQ